MNTAQDTKACPEGNDFVSLLVPPKALKCILPLFKDGLERPAIIFVPSVNIAAVIKAFPELSAVVESLSSLIAVPIIQVANVAGAMLFIIT